MKPQSLIPSRLLVWMGAITCVLMVLPVWAAPPVYLVHLKANGTEIHGDSTVTSMERENSIECLSYSEEVWTPREPGTGQATGRRQYLPITFTKRVDKSSPFLHKALTENQLLDGEFRFFRPNPAGDGTEQHYFTIKFFDGHVSSIRRISPDTLDPVNANRPVIEEVSIVFERIEWTYEPNGATHNDSWSDPT